MKRAPRRYQIAISGSGSKCPLTAAFTRWDEKAGLPRDAIRSQRFDVLEAQRKGDRQCRRLALCEGVQKTFSKGS